MTATAIAPAKEPQTDIKLQLHRVYPVDAQTIFEAWTKPEVLKEWFGPAHLSVKSASVDARVGGAYRIEMQGAAHGNDDPEHVTVARGVYTVFEPGKELAFTWVGTWAPGEETLVTVSLKPVQGGTELLLTHERFATVESKNGHNGGWTASLDKLARMFSGS